MKNDNFKDTVSSVWDDIVEFAEKAWDKISDLAVKVWDNVSDFAERAWDDLGDKFIDSPTEASYVVMGLVALLLLLLIICIVRLARRPKDWYREYDDIPAGTYSGSTSKRVKYNDIVWTVEEQEALKERGNEKRAAETAPKAEPAEKRAPQTVTVTPQSVILGEPEKQAAPAAAMKQEQTPVSASAAQSPAAEQPAEAEPQPAQKSSAPAVIAEPDAFTAEPKQPEAQPAAAAAQTAETQDPEIVMEKINLIKAVPAMKYGPNNQDTSRSGRIFTEEELRELIKE